MLNAFAAGTNLFLINPAGVIFGEHASMSVLGSFHVSTADYLGFQTGPSYSVPAPTVQPEPLSAAAPAAFGFLGLKTPAAISIQGNALAPTLQVPNSPTNLARTLSVVGGNIDIRGPVSSTAKNGSTILAPRGLVQIVSVASAGEATMVGGTTPDVTFTPATTRLGDITLHDGATIRTALDSTTTPATAATGGGTVLIRGGNLIMDHSSILSNNYANAVSAPLRAIDVRLTGDMTLTSAEIRAENFASFGLGGEIVANVGSLSLLASRMDPTAPPVGSMIRRSSQSFNAGTRGGVTINATGPVTISGPSEVSNFAGLSEKLGGVTIVSGSSLTMSEGGTISSRALSTGTAGDITVTLKGPLTMTDGSTISGTSVLVSSPAVTVTADSVLLSGQGPLGAANPSGIVNTSSQSVAGDIFLNVRNLTVTDGAVIRSGSDLTPQGGKVTVTSREPVIISAGGSISSQTSRFNVGELTITAPALTIDNGLLKASTVDVGKAGDIVLTTGTLNVTDGGQIQSSSVGNAPGAGGSVTINAGGSVSLAGAESGVFSTADVFGTAGRITVTTPSLTLSDGARMSVTTQGAGPAGDIALNLSSLAMAGGARIDSGTSGGGHGGHITISAPSSVSVVGGGVSSNATAAGPGGNVSINTAQMALTEHATISATSTGTPDANAGNIAVVIGNSLRIQNSAITTSATTADGGNISITTTGSQLYLLNGKITTSVQSGLGQGGNITIGSNAHPIEFVILNGSEIRADAFGGPGGNINVFAGTFLTTSSILSASSALGVPGTIGIQAGVTDVSSTVSQLPESVLQASTLLRAACATRLAGGQSSSLVVSGREGLPAEPGGVLPSPLVAEGPADSPLSLDDSSGHDDPSNRIALWVPAPRCLR